MKIISWNIFRKGNVLLKSSPFILWRYMIVDFFFSFSITLLFFVIIFIVNQILLLAKNILQIDIPFIEVIKLVYYILPTILSMSIPFATLVACLMSVGHFSTFNEFVAMKANGISFLNIFMPYLIFAVGIMGFSLVSNEILLPWGAINYSQQYRKILSLNPQLGLEQNSIKRYQDNIIITKRVSDTNIEGLIIIDDDSVGDKRVILADKAHLRANANNNGIISIELNNINSISVGSTPTEYNYLLGEVMLYNILLKDLTLDVQTLSPDQQSSKDLFIDIKKDYRTLVEPQSIIRSDIMAQMTNNVNEQYRTMATGLVYNNNLFQDTPAIDNATMEEYYKRFEEQQSDVYFNKSFRISQIILYRKLAFPIAIVLFVIIAFPMGTFYKRSGRTVGFGVGLIMSFLYWFLIIVNQSIGVNSESVSAFWIMWYPNVIMLVVGAILIMVKRN